MARPAATRAFEAWNASGERQEKVVFDAPSGDFQPLAAGDGGPVHKRKGLTLGPDRHDGVTARRRRPGEGGIAVAVGVEHGGPAALQEGVEQPQLGGAIGAPWCRDSRRWSWVRLRKPAAAILTPVQPPLVDAVRRGFQRQVG